MNRRHLFVLAALVMALSYLGGTLAPPLHAGPLTPVGAAGPAAPAAITIEQWAAVDAAISVLLDQNQATVYLPMIER
jgi:hypothetical protein